MLFSVITLGVRSSVCITPVMAVVLRVRAVLRRLGGFEHGSRICIGRCPGIDLVSALLDGASEVSEIGAQSFRSVRVGCANFNLHTAVLFVKSNLDRAAIRPGDLKSDVTGEGIPRRGLMFVESSHFREARLVHALPTCRLRGHFCRCAAPDLHPFSGSENRHLCSMPIARRYTHITSAHVKRRPSRSPN